MKKSGSDIFHRVRNDFVSPASNGGSFAGVSHTQKLESLTECNTLIYDS